MSPTAIRFLKSAFLVATDGLAGLQEFAGNATGLYYTTDEAHEGSTAFLEKRQPDYSQVPAPPVSLPPTSSSPLERPSTLRIWLLAARPATLPAALSGVVVGSARPLARRAAVPPRHGDRLPRGRAPAPDRRQLRERPVRLPARAPTRPTGQGPLRVAAAGLVTQRQLEIAIGFMFVLAGIVGLVAGVRSAGRSCSCSGSSRSSPPSPTPAGRGRTAIAGSARSSCSCSSGSWRSSGRRTSRPAAVRVAVRRGRDPGRRADRPAILVVNNLRDIPTDTGGRQADARGHARAVSGDADSSTPAAPGRRVRRAGRAGAAGRGCRSCCSRRC